MHSALNTFIERGEKELEGLEEPQRTIRAAALHNEMLLKFELLTGEEELLTGEEEFDGNLLADGPITDKDVEDRIIEDHDNREEQRTANEMAEEGCYREDDGDSEPRIRGMMKGPTDKEFGQVFSGVPDPRIPFLRGVVDAPVAPDIVDLGGIYEERVTEKMGGISVRHDLFTRTARRNWRTGVSNRAPVVRNYQKTCEFCEEKFLGTKNAKYCNRCKAPQFAAVRQRLREEKVT